MDNSKKIDLLKKKIEFIENKQIEFQDYISNLKNEINALDSGTVSTKATTTEKSQTDVYDKTSEQILPNFIKDRQKHKAPKTKSIFEDLVDKFEIKSNLENFIGTNLINKIGILILIFGVVIGSKYAIENDLISPMTRIIIGYLISFGLLAFAIKLKANYLNFSAVLLSGALSLLYFLSFISYDFYQFIPQSAAFGLMFLFTIFSILASLNYNKQVIALIGLVGSYAIPFLLSNDSNNILFLFSYISLVNIGILIISFQKYWKTLFYSAFVFTWLIFSTWFLSDYQPENFYLGLSFAVLYFLIFYITFIAYKVIKKETFARIDIVFILLNSFIFFSLGYSILQENKITINYLGLFAIVNAFIHFLVSKFFFTKENTDEKIFYLTIGLVFIFITMAIPIQLDGNWVTLLWSLEAALLFWLGRSKKIKMYEYISYPLILLSYISLWQDWSINSYFYENTIAFLNPIFLTAMISTVVYAFINYIHFKSEDVEKIPKKLLQFLNFALPIIFISTLYFSFSNEINELFSIEFSKTVQAVSGEDYNYNDYNYDILKFRNLSLIFYSALFVLGLALFNFKKMQNHILYKIIFVASLLMLFISLTAALLICSELRYSYLLPSDEKFYETGSIYLYIRYINFAFVALLVYSIYMHIQKTVVSDAIGKYFGLLLHLVILWFLSSELLHWLNIYGNVNAYKLALSILWGSYSLLMVVLGLWKNLKFTRIGAIVLFAITLVKLFLYDISNLSAVYKTIVLIILGVLLLIISFLYNKYSNKNGNEFSE